MDTARQLACHSVFVHTCGRLQQTLHESYMSSQVNSCPVLSDECQDALFSVCVCTNGTCLSLEERAIVDLLNEACRLNRF